MKQRFNFGILHCAGQDAASFLQGQLSADVLALTESQGGLACYLNLKGRVVALIYLLKRDDGFWLVLSQDLIQPLLHKLKKFIVFSKATLTDISGHYAIAGLMQPPETGPAYHVSSKGNTVLFHLSPSHGLTLAITPSTEPSDLSPHFVKAMFEAGLPWIGLEQSEKFLPHYINLVTLQAISFDKGCFVGQEVVARMHYRGHLDKKLVLMDEPALPGDEVVDVLQVEGKTYSLVSKAI